VEPAIESVRPRGYVAGVASYPSDELAERRARRDGPPAGDASAPTAGGGLELARHDVAVLTARVGETVAERDRMAALAAARREQLTAAREREAALRARIRVADSEVARARAELAARTASEAGLRVQATGLHARIHALRASAAAHDARMRELTAVVESLSGVSSAARADVERHLAAREAAEEALAAERDRAAGLADEVATLRADLEALHRARDHTLGAEERVRAARTAELAALRASSERLRALPVADGAVVPDLASELARAAERLRSAAPAVEDEGEGAPGSEPEPVRASAPAVAAPVAFPPVLAPPRRPAHSRAGGVRAFLHRLLDRRG
jgi:chromosome segregation protein